MKAGNSKSCLCKRVGYCTQLFGKGLIEALTTATDYSALLRAKLKQCFNYSAMFLVLK